MNQAVIDKLLKDGLLRKLQRPAFDQVDRLLATAAKDLGIVRKILAIDEAKAYDIAYDIMFKSALALMRAHGFRPSFNLQHKTTVQFCEAILDASWKSTFDYLDDMRQKRNRLTYEGDVVIGRQEAEASISEAEKFHAALVKIIEPLRPRP